MSIAYINFEREKVDGPVAVGSYLSDVFGRFGITVDSNCDRSIEHHDCEIIITSGEQCLSELTSAELEHFGGSGRNHKRRLICDVRIIKAGEISIMTNEPKEEPKQKEHSTDKFQQEFEAMPLEKKIASLLRLEAVTIGETFAYVVNSPMKVVEKVGDVIAEFGIKLENEARKASRPKEPGGNTKDSKASGGKTKSRTRRKPSSTP